MTHLVDIHVGKRIRQRRCQMGLTQENLGQLSGVKFQQIQKYETGANRVSASRLWCITESLGVEVAYFYEGLDENSSANGSVSETADYLTHKETAVLIKAYYRIPTAQRKKLADLAKVLAA